MLYARATHSVKAVATGDEIALHFRRVTMIAKPYLRGCGIEVVNSDIFGLEENLTFCSQARCNQIFHNFLLGIDGDSAPGKGLEIDSMALFSEANFNAVMDQPFPLHALADAHFH